MSLNDTSEKVLKFSASKSEFKGGMDKICGTNNDTLVLIKQLIEGSDVTIGRTGNEIRITDRYDVGLGDMVLKAFNSLRKHCQNNQSSKEKEIPKHIVREAFSGITTAVLSKKETQIMEAFKNNNIEIKTPNNLIIKPLNDNQRSYMYSLKVGSKGNYILGLGEAGTGKTYLAVAAAVEALEEGRVEKIILTRPVVATEDMGFLPGDATEKMHPYMQPLYDALSDTLPVKRKDELLKEGIIQIAPLAFMRGRTLKNAFVILDEAQNTTMGQMKMFLTRMGENCHVAICGDVTQNDLKGTVSGLEDLIQRINERPSIVFQQFQFNKNDVVRSEQTQEAVDLYANTSPMEVQKVFPFPQKKLA